MKQQRLINRRHAAPTVAAVNTAGLHHDLVRRQPLQALGIVPPVGSRIGGHTPIVVQVYALGSGVAIKGQGSDLPCRQGAFELETNGKVFVFDPLGAGYAYGLVASVEGDVPAIFLSLQAVDQEHLPKLGYGAGHGGAPSKTIILNLPQGCGKSRMAHLLTGWLGCNTVVDEWRFTQPLKLNALHLTNHLPPQAVPA